MWEDELKQTMEIYELECWDRTQQYRRNEQELIDKEQWEHIAFLCQQLLE
jgi:hypothetical protein